MNLADVLAAHQSDGYDYCSCGWRMSPDFGSAKDLAAHQVEAVAAALDVDKIAAAICRADHPKADDEVIALFVRDVGRYRHFAAAAIEAVTS